MIHQQNFDSRKKKMTFMDPLKIFLTYATHTKIMTHVKNILNKVTHVKIQPTQPMQLRNSQTHVTHITR